MPRGTMRFVALEALIEMALLLARRGRTDTHCRPLPALDFAVPFLAWRPCASQYFCGHPLCVHVCHPRIGHSQSACPT